MKFIRYMLSHAILLAFIIAIGFAYYYRGQLFPADINARIDDTVNRAMVWVKLAVKKDSAITQEKADSADVQAASNLSAEVKPDNTVAKTDTPATAATIVPESAAAQVVNESSSQVNEKTAPASAGTELKTSEVESKTSETAAAKIISSNKEQTSTEQPKTDTEATARTTDEAEKPDLIDQARLAYQAGDHAKSIAHYKQASKSNPDDPNAYGEMGNVYYLQGKWQQAGQAYYEAATRLLAQGHAGQVQYLYRVIQGLDQESAKKLSRQLGAK